MDKIIERFNEMSWRFAPQDPEGCAALEGRIRDTGRRGALITYSDLVRGVSFRLPGRDPPEHQIDVREWQEVDRSILGDYLGYLSMQTYQQAEFFCSALVVSKETGMPGEGFFGLLKDLGLISSSKTNKATYIWSDHVAKAHAWYGSSG
jgi:hypothetical protein